MGDALLVLNAGSSSLKFSLFVDDDPPAPLLRGQIEELTTRARFTVRRGPATVDELRLAERDEPRPRRRDRVPVRAGGQAGCPRRLPHRCGRPSDRARRDAVRGAHPHRWASPGRAREARPPRASAPAPQSRGGEGGRGAGAGPSAGGLLRHGLPPDAAGAGPGLRSAGVLHRRGYQAIRISRSVGTSTSRRCCGSAIRVRRSAAW